MKRALNLRVNSGDVSGLTGDVSRLYGNVSGLTGDVDDCEISENERQNGVDISDLVLGGS